MAVGSTPQDIDDPSATSGAPNADMELLELTELYTIACRALEAMDDLGGINETIEDSGRCVSPAQPFSPCDDERHQERSSDRLRD